MTRTARAAYPRAVLKDRSESRSGRDPSIRKDGAGQHNWGSIADEQELEFKAMEDEIRDAGLENSNILKSATVSSTASDREELESVPGKPEMSDEEELEKALQYRKHAFKKQGEIDLVHIARTSAAVAGAPRLSNGVARRPSQDNRVAIASVATVSV